MQSPLPDRGSPFACHRGTYFPRSQELRPALSSSGWEIIVDSSKKQFFKGSNVVEILVEQLSQSTVPFVCVTILPVF